MAVGARKSKEEQELEIAVFGDTAGFDAALKKFGDDGEIEGDSEAEAASNDESANEMDSDDALFYVDKGENSDEEDGMSLSSESDSSDEDDSPAWRDSDDDTYQVSLLAANRLKKLRHAEAESNISARDYEDRLRAQFEKLYPRPQWASLRSPAKRAGGSDSESDEDFGDDDDDEQIVANPLRDVLNRKTSYVTSTKTKLLPASDLDIQRLADITKQLQSVSSIQSVHFHPTQPLVLTSGYDRSLRIYQVDGKANPVATSLHIEKSPFKTAMFHPDGRRVFASGPRRYIYIWNLDTGAVEKVSRTYGHDDTQITMERFVISPDGQYVALVGVNGWINVLSADSAQWLAGAKIEGDFADLAWTEPETITIANTSGEVWHWDVESRQTRSRWQDPSLTGVTKIAQNKRWIAVGMKSGVVAIYDRLNPKRGMSLSESEPEVWEASFIVDNLVTSITDMKFSPDGQILAISSSVKRDALRMVHVPSFTVFKNWPTSNTPLGQVSAIAWSPQNQMFIAGNLVGHVRLWSLNHYS